MKDIMVAYSFIILLSDEGKRSDHIYSLIQPR